MEMKPGYKRTEVGVIPDDWDVFQLAGNFHIYAGGDVPKHSASNVRSDAHPYPIFANALQDKGLYGFTGERRAKANSLTITARGYLGHAEYRDEEFFPIVRLLVLEPNGALDARFTAFAVNERVKFAFESTGVPQLTAPQVGKYSVAAPPLPEQRAIAEALSDVDALLGGLDRLIAKKRELKQAAMQQLLTGQTRLPGFTSDWEHIRLGDLFTFKNGLNKGKEFFGHGTPIVNYMDVFSKGIIYGSKLEGRVSLTSQELKNFDVNQGDVLFTRTSETPEEIGIAAVVFDVPDQTVFSGFVLRGRPKDNRLCDPFKAYCFGSKGVRQQIISKASYTTRALTNGRVLSDVVLALPPLTEQYSIAEILGDLDHELNILEQRIAKTRAVKQGMMQELLTGRTRLI